MNELTNKCGLNLNLPVSTYPHILYPLEKSYLGGWEERGGGDISDGIKFWMTNKLRIGFVHYSMYFVHIEFYKKG